LDQTDFCRETNDHKFHLQIQIYQVSLLSAKMQNHSGNIQVLLIKVPKPTSWFFIPVQLKCNHTEATQDIQHELAELFHFLLRKQVLMGRCPLSSRSRVRIPQIEQKIHFPNEFAVVFLYPLQYQRSYIIALLSSSDVLSYIRYNQVYKILRIFLRVTF